MYYSITFEWEGGKKNTWTDWHLVPTSRPVVNPPAVKTEYIEVPGADGALDYTGVLGGIKYKNREGSWEFQVVNGWEKWNVRYTSLLSCLHGQRRKIYLESDPEYYYNGRLFVDKWASGQANSTVTVKYIIDPYKYPIHTTSETDWLWDDLFNLTIFYGTFDVDGIKARNLINPIDQIVIPTLTCTSRMTVDFQGRTVSLPDGTAKAQGLALSPGDNFMTFRGNGRVVVDYDTGRTL